MPWTRVCRLKQRLVKQPTRQKQLLGRKQIRSCRKISMLKLLPGQRKTRN